MAEHRCTGDVETCGVCSYQRDLIEDAGSDKLGHVTPVPTGFGRSVFAPAVPMMSWERFLQLLHEDE